MNFRRHALAGAVALCLSTTLVSPGWTQGSSSSPALPTLFGTLAEVLNADPQVRSARANVDAAEARTRQARSRYWPSAGMQGAAGHSTDRENNDDVQRRTERLEGVLRWNLYNGGTDRTEIAATERELASVQAEFERTRSDVVERITEAWLDYQKLQAVASASRRRIHDVATLTNQVVSQGAAGRVSEADVLQAQVALSESQVAHDLALSDVEAARAKLETLIGRPLPGIAPAGFAPLVAPDSLVHPSVRAARERADAATARQRQLAEALAPRLDLEVRQRLVDRTDPAPTTAQRRGATVSMTWDVPLGGETFAKQDEAMRRAEGARAEADRVELLLKADLAALRQRERAATEAVERSFTQVEQSRGLVRAASVQFEAGRRTVQQLIQSRESQFSAEQRYAEAQARLQQLRMRQWSTAGALLAAVGLDTPAANVAAAAPPVMEVPASQTSWRAQAPAVVPAAPAAVLPGSVVVAAPATRAVPAAPVAAPQAGRSPVPSAAPGSEAEVMARLSGWQTAWRGRDVDGYLGYYAKGFVPNQGMSRAAWESQRRRMVGQRGAIEVDIVGAKAERRGEATIVDFEQRYRSDMFRDTVRKRLEWVREDGNWKIIRESTQ